MTSNNYNFLFNFRVVCILYMIFSRVVVTKIKQFGSRFPRFLCISEVWALQFKYLRQSFELIQIALELLIDGIIVVSLCLRMIVVWRCWIRYRDNQMRFSWLTLFRLFASQPKWQRFVDTLFQLHECFIQTRSHT